MAKTRIPLSGYRKICPGDVDSGADLGDSHEPREPKRSPRELPNVELDDVTEDVIARYSCDFNDDHYVDF